MLVDDPIVTWPELGQVRTVDAEEELKTYDSHGMPVMDLASGPCVVSLPEGSEHALYLLGEELSWSDVVCISVRRAPGMNLGWWGRLEDRAKQEGIRVAEHNRHDVNEVVALHLFEEGLKALGDCHDLFQGAGIDPSPEAMRTEQVLARAVAALRATGFRAPRSR